MTTTTTTTTMDYANFDEPLEIDHTILRQHIKWILEIDGEDGEPNQFDQRHYRRGYDGDIYARAVQAIAHEITLLPYEPGENHQCYCSGETRQFDDGAVADAMENYVWKKQGHPQPA